MGTPQSYTLDELKVIMRDVARDEIAPMRESTSLFAKILTESTHSQTPPVEKGIRFARAVKSMLTARDTAMKGGHSNPVEAAKALYPEDKLLEAALTKALGESTGATGGFLVPVEFAREIIELLYDKTVVRKAGARVVPMQTNTLNIPRLAGGATASYIGENVNITSSQQNLEQVQLAAKKLAVLVPVSNDLIRDSSPAADRIVRDDIVAKMATTEDVNFIRATGSSYAPKGIASWMQASNVTTVAPGTAPTLAAAVGSLKTAISAVKIARKDQLINPGWIFSVRSELFLRTLLNANGFFVFKDEMDRGRLLGYPYYVTTSIPENLTVNSTDSSEIYFVEFSDALIGENLNMEIAVSQEAAYFDGTSVVAAFAQDQTVVRAIARHDFALRHNGSAALLQGVEWT